VVTTIDLGLRQVLTEREGDVAGARRHVDQEEVGLAPVGVHQKLLQRFVQHRAPPDDRRVVGNEVAHRQAPHPVGGRRHHQVPDDHGIGLDPEHLRNGEPVDVGVEDADVESHAGQGNSQVDGDRRLPDAALPDEIPRILVFERGSMNRLGRPSS
jgi:hypothetical protein